MRSSENQQGGVWGSILEAVFDCDKYDEAYALVIGISDYKDEGFDDLTTEQDAIRIKDYLLNEINFDYVHLITEEKVTKDRIEELMVDELPRSWAQVIGLFFTGQGTAKHAHLTTALAGIFQSSTPKRNASLQ